MLPFCSFDNGRFLTSSSSSPNASCPTLLESSITPKAKILVQSNLLLRTLTFHTQCLTPFFVKHPEVVLVLLEHSKHEQILLSNILKLP